MKIDISNAYIQKKALSADNIQFYREYGFLVAKALFSQKEIAALKAETASIFRGERGQISGLLPPAGLNDDEILKQYVAIHFPHKLSSLIKENLSHPDVIRILKKIVSPNLKCMQSMLFVKAPGKAGQSWHQDEFYIPTRDKSLVGVWIAVDDATEYNGCLWIIPGSHKPGFMRRRVANLSDEYADVDTVDVSGFYPDHQVPVEVSSGSVVFFNGYTLHSSKRNKTKNCFRTALVNHYMSAESMLPWDQDGKLEPTEDLRDIVLVAGKDPYAYKGTVDVNQPYLRPEVLNIKTS
ncbi:Ectoine hydroxylase-related dioxygenase, phytanoyl-CoA dioxygenase (PhyH) family [Mucilaginibacter pineti]|uniref:Ectoine hydroxylase-related dioxygenase, phytanoyl-CoA dioxygenase (PhyH) family n=1 Tax=Mucilaginibacter pineti TaxID=1391627 RepID=A0A1G7GAI2_9SPHI|nr:phytanoyl-CoA dioxygenase family protein [Mucilaginibacter pineti]SDE85164.1 Ectoine hydroxylase-related dioxygenase, phytanoyl-CoA dioxygenase (PhyH) family [Mucilaginibacter pineti]